ncbi:hypothetical protein WMY93_023100 [Mugilogobius chulae]|uniref:Uncharacterized protein n=1 Tax=Mugilogobius chulae TaxID=88201 RepID=A0AAW0NFF6_9GOBI
MGKLVSTLLPLRIPEKLRYTGVKTSKEFQTELHCVNAVHSFQQHSRTRNSCPTWCARKAKTIWTPISIATMLNALLFEPLYPERRTQLQPATPEGRPERGNFTNVTSTL